MKIGVSVSPTKTFFGPVLYEDNLNMLCDYVSSFGYEGIELSLISPDVLTSDREQIIRQFGLQVFGIATGQSYVHEGICLYSESDELRSKAVKKLKDFVPIANAHNCPIIIGGIRGNEKVPEKSRNEVKKRGDDAIMDLVESASRRKVKLLLEPINRYESLYYHTVSSCRSFIIDNAIDNISILADTFHMNIEEVSINDTIANNMAFIAYVHIADSNRLYPGAGHTDFISLFATILSQSFEGTIGIEALPVPNMKESALNSIKKINSIIEEIRHRED